MTYGNLSVLKSKDISLPTKVHIVKAMVFLVVMYRCESWTIKKADHQRIDAFKLWCWRRLLRVPWNARSNQLILRESTLNAFWKSTLNPHWKVWCWNWSSSTLATWCEELTHWRSLSWEKLKAEEKGMAEDGMVGWHHWLNGHEFEQAPGTGDGQGSLACFSPWRHKESDMTGWLNWELLNQMVFYF